MAECVFEKMLGGRTMKNVKKRKQQYIWIGLVVFVLVLFFGVNQYGNNAIKAAEAEYMIRFTGEEEGSRAEYTLKNRTITATYVDSQNKAPEAAKVEWIVTGETDAAGKNKILEITSGVNDANVVLKAIGAGTAELTAAITVDGEVIYASRKITVGYAIEEDNKDGFMLIPELSEEAVMVLSIGDTSSYNSNNTSDPKNTLNFVFPCENVTWRSENSHVVSMSETTYESMNTTGYFRAVGTGVTKITGTYTTEEGKSQMVSATVYVGPKAMVGDKEIDDSISIKNGTLIYTGAILAEGNTIKDHLEWVVRDENDKIISSSKDTEEKILISSAYSSNLTVDAKAGTYYITFYTAGVYSAGLETIGAPLSQTFKIYVQAEPSNVIKSLQVNDIYDIAEAYNLEAEDFRSCFDVQVTSGSAVAIITQIDEGIVNTAEEGKALLTLKVKDRDLLSKLTGKTTAELPTEYTIELNVYKGFVLDRTAVTIAEGASLALVANYNEGIAENITWSSSDTNFVTVTQKGIITGVKDSSGNEILVTASMQLSDGRTLKATCRVTVTKTAEEIILSETELRLQVGQTATITASFIPSSITSIPGLKWLVTDEDVVSIEEGSEKSVIVTAKGAGTTILTAVNEDNFVAAYCKITVLAPITTISIVEGDQMTVRLAQEYIKFHTEINDDATDVDLIWSSSVTSVATVDETGFVTLKGAGTTVITVMPEWNPKNVMAQCRVTVIESASSFNLNNGTITIAAGEKYELEYTVAAKEASTTVTWKVLDSSVASVANKTTTVEKGVKGRQTLTGVSAGMTYIVASTSEGYVSTCKVIVTQKASGVTLDTYDITLAVGESYTVKATANPVTATEKTFVWSSAKPAIAKVDGNGKITGVSAGSTFITVLPPTGRAAIVYVTVYSKATGMELNKESITLVKGDSFTLKPIFKPSDVTNKNVTFTSLNAAVASISDKGKVKALKGGSTIITAVSEDGGYIATCLVTVKEKITSIKLNKSSYKLGVGDSITLKATVTSNSASNPKIKWTTSNKKIATVNQNGKVTGKKVGTATIKVKVTDGTNKTATCKIRVVKEVTKITLNKRILTVVVGQTEKLKATIKPKDATIKSIKWTSANPEIADVDGGEVLGLTPGSTKVTAAARDNSGKKAVCYVNVIEEVPATSIVLSAQNLTLTKGQSQKIGYSIVPYNHTDKVSFDSDNRAVATVSGTGKVYARRAGIANIIITTTSGKQATVKVTVIGLNKTKVTMQQYDTETLFIEGVTSGISWFSSNPSVATVTGGKIVARREGTCTIIAKYNGVNLSCRVVVTKIR